MSPGRTDRDEVLVQRIAAAARAAGVRVAVAESLTGGLLASRVTAGDNASDWFRGGVVVADAPAVTFELLGVDPGPVNTVAFACQMGRGAVRALDAEIAVAATGVGGPGPDDSVPAGTVFIACADWAGQVVSREEYFAGPPSEVVAATISACLELLAAELTATPDSEGGAAGLSLWRDCHRVDPQRAT